MVLPIDRTVDIIYPDDTLPTVKTSSYFAAEVIWKSGKKEKTPLVYLKTGRSSLEIHCY